MIEATFARLLSGWNTPLGAKAPLPPPEPVREFKEPTKRTPRGLGRELVPYGLMGGFACERSKVETKPPPPPQRPDSPYGKRFGKDLTELLTRETAMRVPTLPAPQPKSPHFNLRQVRDAVCEVASVEVWELCGSLRHPAVVKARELFAVAAHRLCTTSYPEIGRAIGKRNHTTVFCAAARFGRRKDGDELLTRVAGVLARRGRVEDA